MSDDLTGLNLVELFDRLIQPEPPAPISMWPQTVGWLWLGCAATGLILFALWRYLKWRRATAYRRAGLAALRAAGDDPAAIAMVLRRTALAGFPRADVAGLYGPGWLAFLDHSAPAVSFTGTQAGQVLCTAPYRPHAGHPDLAAQAALWIRTHRAPDKRRV